jgi:hypothetical protein
MGGGYKRIKAFRDFLTSRNHSVDLIQFPGESYATRIWYYYQRAHARLRGHERRRMTKMADRLEKRINEKKYDVVIGVETTFSYVLTREMKCLKIFSCESLEAEELYFSKKTSDLGRIRSAREIELEIMMKSDYVVFPWETTENYVRKYVWNGDNFITIRYGCYPQTKPVSYFFPVSIICLGNFASYWSNTELLSYLTRISPYVIDVYGQIRPKRKYHLNYKGFAPSLNIFINYQFGLNTVSKDVFRRNHHASRIMSYLEYGLPVLSPDWMKFSHELKGVIPYNEDNFSELLEKNSVRDQWERLSRDGHQQARELDWRITLKPLEKLIEK